MRSKRPTGPVGRDALLAKRGFFFTMVVLLFLVILLAFFATRLDQAEEVAVERHQAETMDDFLLDLHLDLDRAAYITGFRSLIALEEYIMETGDYLDDADARFVEAFVNGTVEGEAITVIANTTFVDYLQRVNLQAADVGLRLNVTVGGVALYQISPWDVAVDYDVHVTLNDTARLASWEYDRVFTTLIPITDLRDPLYSVGTNGKSINTIRRLTNISEFVDDAGDKNDTTALLTFLDGSYYVASSRAPNFVMRMEGNLTGDENGIESLVNLEELDAQGIYVYTTRSVVDYQYFDGVDADYCDIQNMPEYFRIADDHFEFYEIDGELEYTACS